MVHRIDDELLAQSIAKTIYDDLRDRRGFRNLMDEIKHDVDVYNEVIITWGDMIGEAIERARIESWKNLVLDDRINELEARLARLEGEQVVATDQYLCQSYFDDNNVLQDCTCGKCA